MKIITITINPAYDLHFDMKDYIPYKENYASSVMRAAGGKGINISRALTKNNIENTAFVILGKMNASDFVSQLRTDGLNFKEIYCEGKIRENITIHTPDKPETRISSEGFLFTGSILGQLFEELKQEVDGNTIITFTGRIPTGLTLKEAEQFLIELRSLNHLLVVDCNSFSLDSLKLITPWLIKPNKQEIEALTGKKINTVKEAIESAAEIQKTGIENVFISMGKDGMAAALKDLHCIVVAPRITPLSTVGAGDSMLGGFIGAYSRGLSSEECLKIAVSYGTAACLTKGTAPPERRDIERLKQDVRIIRA